MVTWLIETHTTKIEPKIWFLHPLKTQLLMQRISPVLQKYIFIPIFTHAIRYHKSPASISLSYNPGSFPWSLISKDYLSGTLPIISLVNDNLSNIFSFPFPWDRVFCVTAPAVLELAL